MQDDPQALRLVGSTQTPLQGFFPVGQVPSQESASGMHVLRQGLRPAGQETPQRLPSQVATPPSIVAHASQETPQVAGARSSTHWPPHR